jgi:hypothetical protein
MNFDTVTKTKFSSNYWVWKNIEKFVANHYICLLDNLLCITDDTKTDPLLRYKEFTVNFSRHFGLISKSGIWNGKNSYPYIGVSFGSGNRNRFYNCSEVVDVYFHIFLNPKTPKSCDTPNCSSCIIKNEEEWFNCVIDQLIDMFGFNYKTTLDNGYIATSGDLFEHLYCKKDRFDVNWEYNMKVRPIGEPFVSEIVPRDDEILEAYVQIPLKIISKSKTCDCDDPTPCNCE